MEECELSTMKDRAPEAEHLMCKILDWGTLEAAARFENGQDLYLLSFKEPVSGVTKVQRSLAQLNGLGPRPNPLDAAFGWDASVKYTVYFTDTAGLELAQNEGRVCVPDESNETWAVFRDQLAYLLISMKVKEN